MMEKLTTEFLFEAIEHGKAIAEGDYKKANRHHKRLHNLYNKVKETNQANIFAYCLDNKNESVALWAAIFSLKYFPEIAENTLQILTKSSTIIGLTAKTTLDLWQKGELNLL